MTHDLAAPSFVIHDVSQFPLVIAQHGDAGADHADRWIAEMEALLAQPGPFVLIAPDLDANVAHEARKVMVQWQTQNMPRLRERCRAFVGVAPDPQARAKKQAQADKMTRAFGIAFEVVADLAQARERARAWLAQAPGPRPE